jgi:hypothetical protein
MLKESIIVGNYFCTALLLHSGIYHIGPQLVHQSHSCLGEASGGARVGDGGLADFGDVVKSRNESYLSRNLSGEATLGVDGWVVLGSMLAVYWVATCPP